MTNKIGAIGHGKSQGKDNYNYINFEKSDKSYLSANAFDSYKNKAAGFTKKVLGNIGHSLATGQIHPGTASGQTGYSAASF